jgi:energy-coupling factor transport system ATP-binding protein
VIEGVEATLEPFIRIEGLRHVYPLGDASELAALRGIDLTIRRGEFVALIGPNGSGKSTLAYHLNGLLLPTEGQVWVDGFLTSDPGHLWLVRQRVGMVFQNPDNQLVASTVEEDVAFGPENLALPPQEIRSRVQEALAIVGLPDYLARPPQMLSGGQKQLVAVAGVLASRPACIVFDEPTSMLDPSSQQRVLDTILRLNVEEGLTVVLITQSMDEAAAAQRVIAMHAGRIVADGPPQVVFEQKEQLRSLGLCPPSAIEIARHLRESGIQVPPGLLTVDMLARALC